MQSRHRARIRTSSCPTLIQATVSICYLRPDESSAAQFLTRRFNIVGAVICFDKHRCYKYGECRQHSNCSCWSRKFSRCNRCMEQVARMACARSFRFCSRPHLVSVAQCRLTSSATKPVSDAYVKTYSVEIELRFSMKEVRSQGFCIISQSMARSYFRKMTKKLGN
eukprot:s829_g21.t1